MQCNTSFLYVYSDSTDSTLLLSPLAVFDYVFYLTNPPVISVAPADPHRVCVCVCVFTSMHVWLSNFHLLRKRSVACPTSLLSPLLILPLLLTNFNNNSAHSTALHSSVLQVCHQVEEFNSARIRLAADMADDSQRVKALIVRAEDSRLMVDMESTRRAYTELFALNNQLIGTRGVTFNYSSHTHTASPM
jgi:hypothetical protein